MKALLCACLLLGAASRCSCAEQDAKDINATVDRLIKQLDDNDFKTREEAMGHFADLPAEALPLIEAALKRTDVGADLRGRLQKSLPFLYPKARRKELLVLAQKRSEATTKALTDVYDKFGIHDPKWDSLVRDTFVAIGKWFGGTPIQFDEVLNRATKAIEAGCNDPMIVYAQIRTTETLGRAKPEELRKSFEQIAMRLKDTHYPAIRRLFPLVHAAQLKFTEQKPPTPALLQSMEAMLNLGLELLPESLHDEKAQPQLRLDNCQWLVDTFLLIDKDRKKSFDRVYSIAIKAVPDTIVPHALKANVYNDYAWDARGSGTADMVTQEGRRLMTERLTEAEAAAEKAFAIDPKDPSAPTTMLKIALELGKGRDYMELWFKRAMDANPDNFSACQAKSYFLEPKWHGSAQEMLAFGKECLATKNWDSKIPFILVDAHMALARYENEWEYYVRPGVFADIQSVYEPALEYRNDVYWRSMYAQFGVWCERWDVADKQFKAMGDNYSAQVFKTRLIYDYLRAQAAQKAGKGK